MRAILRLTERQVGAFLAWGGMRIRGAVWG